MSLETDCFGYLVDSPDEKMTCDENFSFLIHQVRDYYGRTIHYNIFIDKLLKEEYLTKEELQLFLELCISRRFLQKKTYIENLYKRIGEAKEKSLTIKGHKTLILTPFGRKRKEHSLERQELWKQKQFNKSQGILEYLEKAISETRTNPLRVKQIQQEFISIEEDSIPPLIEEKQIPGEEDNSIQEKDKDKDEDKSYLFYSECEGKNKCHCICHLMGILCITCKKMQNDAKIFLETSPSEQERKKKLIVIQKRRTLGFLKNDKKPKLKLKKKKSSSLKQIHLLVKEKLN